VRLRRLPRIVAGLQQESVATVASSFTAPALGDGLDIALPETLYLYTTLFSPKRYIKITYVIWLGTPTWTESSEGGRSVVDPTPRASVCLRSLPSPVR
jgi:hypothetical protein